MNKEIYIKMEKDLLLFLLDGKLETLKNGLISNNVLQKFLIKSIKLD